MKASLSMKIPFQIFFVLLGLLLFFSCTEEKNETAEKETSPQQNSELESHPSILEISTHIKKNPNDAKLYYIRSNMRFQLGNNAGAKEDIEKALSIDSTQMEFYIGLADIYFEEKDIIRALYTLEKANEINAYNENVLLKMGIYKIYMKNYKEAIGHLDAVLRLNIHNADAYFYKGILFNEIEKEDRAISSFQTALEQNPSYFEAHMQLALIYAKKEPETALQYYDNALRLDPESTEALYGKGLLLQNMGNYDAAIDLYKNIVKKTPQNANAYYNIGYVYFQMDSLEKADRHFKISNSLNPTYVNAIYMRGLIQEALGNLTKAKEFYKQSLSLQANHEQALKGLERIDKK